MWTLAVCRNVLFYYLVSYPPIAIAIEGDPVWIQTLANRALFGIIDFEMLKHIGVQAVQALIKRLRFHRLHT